MKYYIILFASCLVAGYGPGHFIILAIDSGLPTEAEWYSKGFQYSPWHDQITFWIIINLISFFQAIIFSVISIFSLDDHKKVIISFMPLVIFIIMIIIGFPYYGWALM